MTMVKCLFCYGARYNERIWAAEHWVSVWDKYPAASGHALLVTQRHIESVNELRPAEWDALYSMLVQTQDEIYRSFPGVTGYTIGFNDGRAAGRTVDHLHMHVIPRRPGDVDDPRGGIRNIMPAAPRPWEEHLV